MLRNADTRDGQLEKASSRLFPRPMVLLRTTTGATVEILQATVEHAHTFVISKVLMLLWQNSSSKLGCQLDILRADQINSPQGERWKKVNSFSQSRKLLSSHVAVEDSLFVYQLWLLAKDDLGNNFCKSRIFLTSWPAWRCPGIRAPRWTLLELPPFAITQPRDELFPNEKDCFSLKCVDFVQKAILNRKECPGWTSLHSLHWVMNIPWHTQQRKLKEEQKEWDARKEIKKKKGCQETVMIKFNDMHPTCTPAAEQAMGARNEHATQLWPSRVRVLSMKKKVLVVSALYRSWAVDQYRWVRFAGGCLGFLYAFFSCLYGVTDRHSLLVSCPSEHHPRKEWSSAPSKWYSLNDSWKKWHGVCEIHVHAFLRCYSQEWRVIASSLSIARLSRSLETDVLSQSPCAPRFLSLCAAACSSASRAPFLYWQRMRIPCDTIDTRGLLDFETFLPDISSKYRQTDPRKSAKNRPILGKAYMFKEEL